MILETVFNLLFGGLGAVFAIFPDISMGVSEAVFITFSQIVGFLAYFIPMPTVAAILGVIVSVQMCKILIAHIKTVWQLLPIV